MSGQQGGLLDGKVALIFGASRGIGKAIACGFAEEGARVAAVARSLSAGKLPGSVDQTVREITDAGGEAHGIAADVSDEAAVQSAVDECLSHFGAIDVMVNSAGVTVEGSFAEMEMRRLDLLLRVNMRGALLTTKTVLPTMIERRSGNIIHLTAKVAAFDAPITAGVGYAMTKAAVSRMVTGLAPELAQYGIAINGLIPGRIRSEGAELWEGDRDWTGWGRPRDVVPSALALSGHSAQTMTGRLVRTDELGTDWR